jgi:carboxyl-terminal processing protease
MLRSSRRWMYLGVATLLMLQQGLEAQANPDMTTEAREYLEHALNIMQAEALKRESVDWAEIRADAYRAAAGAQHIRDTYAAINGAVWALGDNHSRFLPPLSELPFEAQMLLATRVPSEPETRRIGDRIGYVAIPGFTGPDPSEFALRILNGIIEVDSPKVCGWIVDLRGNTGGNMWPMLQGLSPILGEGVPGYLHTVDGAWIPWTIDTEGLGARTLSPDQVAVAVLHGSETSSSGEAVVVAFRGRDGARTFGQPTDGLSTGNKTIELSDGARLVLTTSVYADREKNIYGAAIEPDELIPVEAPESQVMSVAKDWLLSQTVCSDG